MIEFLVSTGGKIYEINDLITKVTYQDTFNNGCSKLEFTYISKNLTIQNGSVIRFKYDNTNIFYGYVFKISRGKGTEINVTAYDQLRYCKAKDTLVLKGDTVTTITNKMCNYFKLNKGTIVDTRYVLETSVQEDKTWLDIIYGSISDTLMNQKKWYLLRDEFGSIALRETSDLKLDMILGDESYCYDYQYDKSIDNDFYNFIKLAAIDKEAKTLEVTVAQDETSVKNFGVLQYYKSIDKKYSTAQAKSMADNLLSLYNKEAETISLDCLGDTRIRAGSSFHGQIEDIKLNRRLVVKSVTHKFLPIHTMSLEVMT
ncbi:phage protein [Anaerocolumna cellulosilytica]|uniref:Phage protein n=1 Tax=Anaerocolumna cellulosilytica TaxID=433286 RepID=A0A6S6QPV3_9FIRM|nr:hypothetical protein [Anaerocolumna cellulosilytica]MBB5197933.1 hypothetical protein [Anaerocolumna cellulosilytica]BCJ92594.1 phage protein [Anaerocolumna cellulosilytica]